MKTFEINGVKYNSRPFSYNLICDLEDMGVSLQDMQNKPMSIPRAYFAVCAGLDQERAGEQIEAHLVGGGELTEIMEIISEEMDKSDFFQALSNRETSDPTSGTKTQSKAKK